MRGALVALACVACGGGGQQPVVPVEVRLVDGSFDELTTARGKLVDALAAAPSDAVLIARIAEVDGLTALLYGVAAPEERVFAPVAAGSPGYREWAIGKVAFELTRVRTAKEVAELEALLATAPDDPWRRWLAGRVALARGDRIAATAAFQSEHRLATIDRALMLADDGKAGEGEKSLAADDHVLAVTARAVLRAELDNVAGAVADLELVKIEAPRVAAYRLLATAMIGLANERYDLAAEALGKLGKMRGLSNDCALWARIAWAHLQLGRSVDKTNDHKIASISRQRCAALGKATGDHKLLTVIDANLNLGLGKSEQALALASKVQTPWGRVTVAEVVSELGTPQRVLEVLDKLPLEGPASRVAQVLALQARVQLASGKPRSDLLAELAALADSAKSQRARHALGAAYFAIGDLTAAKRELRRAVEDTSAQSPNPLAYRTHQLLAEIGLATHDLETAGAEIDRALAIHPGNSTTRVIQARILLRNAEPDKALAALAPLRTAGELMPTAKLVAAEALVARKDATADQRAQARALISELVGKAGVVPAELGRVAALVDPQLPKQLGLPVGKPSKQGT